MNTTRNLHQRIWVKKYQVELFLWVLLNVSKMSSLHLNRLMKLRRWKLFAHRKLPGILYLKKFDVRFDWLSWLDTNQRVHWIEWPLRFFLLWLLDRNFFIFWGGRVRKFFTLNRLDFHSRISGKSTQKALPLNVLIMLRLLRSFYLIQGKKVWVLSKLMILSIRNTFLNSL